MTETNKKLVKDLPNSTEPSEPSQVENKANLEFKEAKRPANTLFSDLKRFKNCKITVFLYGGGSVYGKLIEYDEVANCIVEAEDSSSSSKTATVVVLGRSITMICMGAAATL